MTNEYPHFDDPFEWNIFDQLVDYLEKHTCADAFNLLQDAIYYKASENIRNEEDKHAFAHGKIGFVVEYVLKQGIPKDCDRNRKLYKNIGIWCINSGFSDETVKILDKKITSVCPGRKKGELYGWFKWAKRGKRKEVNLNEILDVLKLARR